MFPSHFNITYMGLRLKVLYLAFAHFASNKSKYRSNFWKVFHHIYHNNLPILEDMGLTIWAMQSSGVWDFDLRFHERMVALIFVVAFILILGWKPGKSFTGAFMNGFTWSKCMTEKIKSNIRVIFISSTWFAIYYLCFSSFGLICMT